MHRPIHKFTFGGEIVDDSALLRLRAEYQRLLIQGMRDVGCVPVLDLDTLWSTSYNQETETYDFTISMYGVYVGRRKAFSIEGMSGPGRLHPRSIPKSKSKPS